MHPLGLVALVVLGSALLLVRRRHAALPLLVMACLAGPAQRLVLLGLDFNLLRLLVLVGWMRVVLRGELRLPARRGLDVALLAWSISGTVVFTIYHASWPMFINRCGFLFDAVGMYFLFRLLVRDREDILALIRGVAVISIPLAAAFLLERLSGRNPFAVFGGVPLLSEVREGTVRCQGPFAHPILAGCFWVTLAPLMWCVRTARGRPAWPAFCAVLAVPIIIYCSASSTPIGAGLLGVVVLMLFPLRRFVRWGVAGGLVSIVCLQLAMSRPLWFLLARIDFVGGSMGWYRSKLIDEFIRHAGDWWLLGSDRYAEWWEWGLDDLTNQYVQTGLDGGLVTLLLFLLTIALAFVGAGRACRAAGNRLQDAALAWASGAALLMHATNFLGVSYFGQSILAWYLTLALIATITPPRRRPVRVRAVYEVVSRAYGPPSPSPPPPRHRDPSIPRPLFS